MRCLRVLQLDSGYSTCVRLSGFWYFSLFFTLVDTDPEVNSPTLEMTSGTCCIQWVWHGYCGYMCLRPFTEAFGVCTLVVWTFFYVPLYSAVTCPVLGVTEEHKKFFFFEMTVCFPIRYAWCDSGYILRQSTEDFWTVFLTCST